jgi:hypothetical protein
LPLQSNSGRHRDKPKKIPIGWTNFAAVAIEIEKRGDLKKKLIFHQTS